MPPNLQLSRTPSERQFPDPEIRPWSCPVCDVSIPQERRAGRSRIYCTHACRQRAYRQRRRLCARTRATRERPAERTRSAIHRIHALRTKADPFSALVDIRGHELTVCGLLARPARPGPTMHYAFRPSSTSACRSCTSIVTRPDLVTGSLTTWDPPDIPSHELARYDAVMAKLGLADFIYIPVRSAA